MCFFNNLLLTNLARSEEFLLVVDDWKLPGVGLCDGLYGTVFTTD
jgi:hypothetical protein